MARNIRRWERVLKIREVQEFFKEKNHISLSPGSIQIQIFPEFWAIKYSLFFPKLLKFAVNSYSSSRTTRKT